MIHALLVIAVVEVIYTILAVVVVFVWGAGGPDDLLPWVSPPPEVAVPPFVAEQLVGPEYAIYCDQPELALLASRLVPLGWGVILLVGAVAASGSGPVKVLAGFGLVALAIDGFLQYMLWTHTLYVLTTLRAMRFNGWARRDVEWLAWNKVTEVSSRRSLLDRLFRIATIELHTAHSMSSFRAMRDIERPREFARDVAAKSLLGGAAGF